MKKILKIVIGVFTLLEMAVFIINFIPRVEKENCIKFGIIFAIMIILLFILLLILNINSKNKKLKILEEITFDNIDKNSPKRIKIENKDENNFKTFCNALIEI